MYSNLSHTTTNISIICAKKFQISTLFQHVASKWNLSFCFVFCLSAYLHRRKVVSEKTKRNKKSPISTDSMKINLVIRWRLHNGWRDILILLLESSSSRKKKVKTDRLFHGDERMKTLITSCKKELNCIGMNWNRQSFTRAAGWVKTCS